MNSTEQTVDQFLFAVCQYGAEAVCKSEWLRRYPALNFAYSRPGFLTFKVSAPEKFKRNSLFSTFARTFGTSIRTIHNSSGNQLIDLTCDAISDLANVQHVHVYERDHFLPGDKNFEPGTSALAAEISGQIESRLQSAESKNPRFNEIAEPNASIIDLVIVEPDRWLLGTHVAGSIAQRWPGGVPDIELRDDIISRAYYKLHEALLWSQLPLRENDLCVEIGSAPGGACQLLLENKANVIAIDPADLHPNVAEHSQLKHLKKRSREVRKAELTGARWLFADMNVAPNYTLDAVEDIVGNQRVNIHGMLLTLKFPDWKLADSIGDSIAKVKSWGYQYVKTRQLAFNRREICLMAFKNRATRRMG